MHKFGYGLIRFRFKPYHLIMNEIPVRVRVKVNQNRLKTEYITQFGHRFLYIYKFGSQFLNSSSVLKPSSLYQKNHYSYFFKHKPLIIKIKNKNNNDLY